MQETEIKILEIDVEQTKKELEELCAENKGTKRLYTVYFDTPDQQLKKQNSAIRLTKEGDKTKLTYKISLVGTKKTAYETEQAFIDESGQDSAFDKMFLIITSLGYKPHLLLEKNRTTIELEHPQGLIKYEIDEYQEAHSHIPPFLEIEAHPKMQSRYQENRRIYEVKTTTLIANAAALLGYPLEKTKKWSTMDVLKYYKNKK